MARKHHAAVFDKYSDKRYKRVSLYVEGKLQRGFCLPFRQSLPRPFRLDASGEEQALDSFSVTQAWKMPIPFEA
jgi:G2/mitotic-specific cyclin 3/4